MDALAWLPGLAPIVAATAVAVTAVRAHRSRTALGVAATAAVPPGVPCRTDFGPGYAFTIDGRRAQVAVAATPFAPTFVVDVDGDVPADDLRRRRAALGATTAGVRAVLVLRDRVRVCVRSGTGALDAAARAVRLVAKLERARAAVDGTGPSGGAPIAVRATGDVR